MLWIDAPSTVGFSQCKTNCNFDDDAMATETLSAIKLWYSAKFPELKDNDLYIAGNFYGGRTVPKVALAIHNYN